MARLTKYSSFEALKADNNPVTDPEKSNECYLEFEQFLVLLQTEGNKKKIGGMAKDTKKRI